MPVRHGDSRKLKKVRCNVLRKLIAVSLILALTGFLNITQSTAAESPDTTLVAASWNICKPQCATGPTWEERQQRLVNTFAYANADILGLQEVTNIRTSTHKTQLANVTSMLAPLGYSHPTYSVENNECRRPRDENNQLAGPSPCDNTAAIFFKNDRIQQVAADSETAGITMISSIAPVALLESGARSVAWALLEDKKTGKIFLAISLHTSNAKTPEAETDRVILGQYLEPWSLAKAASLGHPNVPVILMADLNSYQKRQPNGIQTVLTNNNWVDSFSAPIKRNASYSTVNYRNDSRSGFPAKAKKFKKTKKNPQGYATRIDYVMALGPDVEFTEYETVIFLDSKNFFIKDYQASDHQMVKTVLTLR